MTSRATGSYRLTLPATGGPIRVVKDAVTKATAPLQKRIDTLDAELAKVKARPVTQGPRSTR